MKFYEMQTDMTYSHDLLPVAIWTVAFATFAWLLFRRLDVALWAALLVVIHEAFDLLVGFKHFVFGQGSAEVGLGLYSSAPLIGLVIETLICACIVWWFVRVRAKNGRPVSRGLKAGLYIILVGGTLATLPMAI